VALKIKKIINLFSNLFYPKICLFCRKPGSYLCFDCFFKIETFSSPFCPYCKKRTFDGKICKNCKKYLSGFISASSFSQPQVKKLIYSFKYDFIKEVSVFLALLIYRFLNENPEIEFFKNPYDFLIVPIPLHKKRLRWRGFNQSEEIGKHLSSFLKIPQKRDLLLKIKNNSPQVVLEKNEREKNVKGVFRVNEKYLKILPSKKIILLDDVATTLSTLEEAAKVLKKRKAKEIWGVVVAKEK